MTDQIKKLVDQATDLERTMKEIKAQQEEVVSQLQQEALELMKSKKVKTIQFFGTKGNYVLVTKASKVNLLNYNRVHKVFKENISTMISTTQSYNLKKEFKTIAEAIFKGEVGAKTVEALLKEIGLNEKQISVATKKLKGDYIKDKELLKSIGLNEKDIETYIFFIHEAMVCEKIKQALSHYEGKAYEDALGEIRASVIVEEIPKITIKYEE